MATDDIAKHTVHGYGKLHEAWLADKGAFMLEGTLAVHRPCSGIPVFIAEVDDAYGTRLASFC